MKSSIYPKSRRRYCNCFFIALRIFLAEHFFFTLCKIQIILACVLPIHSRLIIIVLIADIINDGFCVFPSFIQEIYILRKGYLLRCAGRVKYQCALVFFTLWLAHNQSNRTFFGSLEITMQFAKALQASQCHLKTEQHNVLQYPTMVL